MTGNQAEQQATQIATLEQIKQSSVAQLLFKAGRLWNEEAIRRLQQRFPAVRLAHTSVLPHVDWSGTRITELATRMGVTKQAASQLVQDMVSLGLLELGPDPDDGRAKRVYFSQDGLQALNDGLQILAQIQSELSAELGPDYLQQLLVLLQGLVPVLEQRQSL